MDLTFGLRQGDSAVDLGREVGAPERVRDGLGCAVDPGPPGGRVVQVLAMTEVEEGCKQSALDAVDGLAPVESSSIGHVDDLHRRDLSLAKEGAGRRLPHRPRVAVPKVPCADACDFPGRGNHAGRVVLQSTSEQKTAARPIVEALDARALEGTEHNLKLAKQPPVAADPLSTKRAVAAEGEQHGQLDRDLGVGKGALKPGEEALWRVTRSREPEVDGSGGCANDSASPPGRDEHGVKLVDLRVAAYRNAVRRGRPWNVLRATGVVVEQHRRSVVFGGHGDQAAVPQQREGRRRRERPHAGACSIFDLAV